MRLCHDLPYPVDSARLFAPIAGRPWAMFLESAQTSEANGRYDFLVSDPTCTLTTRGGVTEIRDRNGCRRSAEDPFHILQERLLPRRPCLSDVPFCGGAVGYFAYDLARRIEHLPSLAEDAERLPEMAVGIYDWALVVDHQEHRALLVGQGRDARANRDWEPILSRFARPAPAPVDDFRVLGAVRSNMSFERYARAFARIQAYIRDGDCYQVNLAQRLSAPAAGDAWGLYQRLRQRNPAPFAAYLNTPQAQVISSSPERFLRVLGDEVETRPVKGTAPRVAEPNLDRQAAEELRASPKNRAENLMIVDLLRNDLGKTCAPGSIEVPTLFELESFAKVHHLVSTVRGRLAPGETALTLLRGCFPGGSVTGAPKLRAMQVIEELEPHRRGVYCGALGYIGFDGAMDSNIAIRTLVYSRQQIRCWAGGGIVADSVLEDEYQETLHKAAPMLEVMESLRDQRGAG